MSSAKKPVVGNWLPEDLIVEVFLRLPNRKPLLRFRCVSKGLRNLIDSPLFNNHWEVSHYSVSDDFTVMCKENNGILFSIEFQSPDNLNSGEETQVLFLCTTNHQFMGCYRGIVCFGVYGRRFGAPNRYVLFNPSNRTIQNCKIIYNYDVPTDFALGCGFDNSKQHDDDDFKIVRFQVQCHVHSDAVVDVIRRVDVYSMRKDSWRQINVEEFGVGYPAGGSDDRIGIWIEGATHWLWRRDYKVRKNIQEEKKLYYIVAFDLQSESSRRMMLPPQWAEKDGSIRLNDFGGRLCACVEKHDNDTTTIWVMEEYGVDTSWSRLYNIAIPWLDPLEFIGYFPRLDGARLLCYTKLLPVSWFWLNTQDGSKEYIQIHKLSRNFGERDVTQSWICVGKSPLQLPYSNI